MHMYMYLVIVCRCRMQAHDLHVHDVQVYTAGPNLKGSLSQDFTS